MIAQRKKAAIEQKKAQCPTCLREVLIKYDPYAQGLIYSFHSSTGSAKMEDKCENALMPYEETNNGARVNL